jgi:hypothetical protein
LGVKWVGAGLIWIKGAGVAKNNHGACRADRVEEDIKKPGPHGYAVSGILLAVFKQFAMALAQIR